MPISNGCTTFVRPLGTILPGAVATISMAPKDAHVPARQKNAMIVAPIARPVGDDGVSTISSAAGRNSSSRARRGCTEAGRATIGLDDLMDSGLQAVERCVTSVRAYQVVMRTIF